MENNLHLPLILDNEQNRLLLQKQISKDFASASLFFDVDFETSVYALEHLHLAVQEQVSKMIALGERKSLSLLYTIDLPEKEFLRLIGQENFVQKLSELIIQREALKIYYRLKYS